MGVYTAADAEEFADLLKKCAAHLDAVSDELKTVASRFEVRLNDLEDVAPDEVEGVRPL